MSNQQPSRVLWIGTNETPEFLEAWQWCNSVARCAHRFSIADAIENPVFGVTRIVLARSSRWQQPALISQLLKRYPLAKFATLLGSHCEGEARTGIPLPGCLRVYWYQWQAVLPDWCADYVSNETDTNQPASSEGSESESAAGLNVFVSRSISLGQSVVDAIRSSGLAAVSNRDFAFNHLSRIGNFVWDDSFVRDEITAQDALAHASLQHPRARHHWLASAPRISTWNRIQSLGFESLHSKPLDIENLTKLLIFPLCDTDCGRSAAPNACLANTS